MYADAHAPAPPPGWLVVVDVAAKVEVAVAAGMTMALAWEVWEYAAFVTRSREVATAYADTVGDLAMGWTGAVAAALLVGLAHPRQRRSPRSGTWGLHVELVSEGGLEPPRPNTGTSTSS